MNKLIRVGHSSRDGLHEWSLHHIYAGTNIKIPDHIQYECLYCNTVIQTELLCNINDVARSLSIPENCNEMDVLSIMMV